MRKLLLIGFIVFGSISHSIAQNYFQFESSAQQIIKYEGFYKAIDTVQTNDTITMELNVKKNTLTLTYPNKSKSKSYQTVGCGKIKGEGLYACTLKDQAWGSLVQIKDDGSEVIVVLTETMHLRLYSLKTIEKEKKG
jgi:hypothetical protein